MLVSPHVRATPPPVNRHRRRLTALAATSLLGVPLARGQSASGTKLFKGENGFDEVQAIGLVVPPDLLLRADRVIV